MSSANRAVASLANAPFSQPVGLAVDYVDSAIGSPKTFVLTFFPDTKLQMVHRETGKRFLSKIRVESVTPTDLYIGNTITVPFFVPSLCCNCSRRLSIVDYADEGTRAYMELRQARAFVMVLPSAMGALGEIVAAVQNGDGRGGGEPERRKRSRGPAVIAQAEMFRCEGRRYHPEPASPLEDAIPQLSGMKMMSLGDAEADELLLPYRGVVSYHAEAVEHHKSSPCVALQIEGGSDVVEEFREACGPADPEMARELRPDTIRALLGVQQATNAVHCTDLQGDGLLVCRCMFGVSGQNKRQHSNTSKTPCCEHRA